jgi:hypothetical protein
VSLWNPGQTLLLIFCQAVASVAMATVIWFVQVVHYPLMSSVGADHLPGYAIRNRELTTWIVLPLMLLELVSSLGLMSSPISAAARFRNGIGLGLLALIWGVTFLISVPHHLQLSERFSIEALNGLVQSNWIRTVAWSVRACLSLWLLWEWVTPPNPAPQLFSNR